MALGISPQFNIVEHFIDRPAAEHPDRVAILGDPSPVTYAELRAMVNRAGNALRKSGCVPGDRALIVLPDSVEFMAAFFGAVKAGMMAVPVNPMTRTADYSYYLGDASPRIAIVHEAALSEFLPAHGKHPACRLVIVLSPGGFPRQHEDRAWGTWLRGHSDQLEAQGNLSTDPAFLLYTSGSGGTPKGAIHQHKDMLVCAESYAKGVLGLRAKDRTFSVSKLFFAYGLGNGMYFPFSVGASTILNPERPKPERIIELVARHRPTVFFSVPTFYAGLLRAVAGGTPADFSSVRLAVSAGEALPPEIFEQFRKHFGLEILDGIGSTEMLQMFISNRPGDARPGTCGREVPNYEARIVDDDGQPVHAGEIGNLWVKGQSAFAGYWNKPELSARARSGDWVVTGDKFTQDAEGYYHYCGRADDMMKVSGMWVSPGEVENALLGHPAIAEAAVVAARAECGLIQPLAFVVLRDGAASAAPEETTRQIKDFVRGRLPGYKCPQEVHFLPELPKTATGKIQRYLLRGTARSE